MTRILTKKDIKKMIEEYKQGDSTCVLGRRYNVSNVAIYNLLKRRNIPMRTPSQSKQEYKINENFFDIIDTEEKAYWLGFICADGYLNFKRNSLSIGLSKKDKNQLNKLRLSLDSNHPINEYTYTYSDFVRLYIGNVHIINSLKKYINSNKTFSLLFPNLQKNLEQHFIRGYFDGDGCVTGNRKNPQFSLTSNQYFLEELKKRLISSGLNNTKNEIRHKKQKSIQTLRYCGINNIKKIYKYLYNNSTIYMERKKNVFEKFIVS